MRTKKKQIILLILAASFSFGLLIVERSVAGTSFFPQSHNGVIGDPADGIDKATGSTQRASRDTTVNSISNPTAASPNGHSFVKSLFPFFQNKDTFERTYLSNPTPQTAVPFLSGAGEITNFNVALTDNFDYFENIPWSDNGVIPAGYSNRSSYAATDGSYIAETMFSFGSIGSSERAWGTRAACADFSCNPSPSIIAFRLKNSTGEPIRAISIEYTGEQWISRPSATGRLDFQYAKAGPGVITDADTPGISWIDFDALDFIGPVSGIETPVNGNLSQNRSLKSSVIALGVLVHDGEEIWIRWVNSSFHGLAIDDFRVQAVTSYAEPEINIRGNGNSILDGDMSPSAADHTDFGAANVADGTVVRTFTVENTGTGGLSLYRSPLVLIGGPHAADFAVTQFPSTFVEGGGTTTFQVTFDPSAAGNRLANITVTNTDPDENPYNFVIQGNGNPLVTLTYDGNGNTGGSVPIDPNSPYVSGSTLRILDSGSLAKDGKTFGGWNSLPDGTGTYFAPGQLIIAEASATLFAQWISEPCFAAGSLDPSFGSGGIVTLDLGPQRDEVNAIVRQYDGRLIAIGYSDSASDQDFAVARYDERGNLDPTFNGTGVVLTDFTGSEEAFGGALQADGKLVVVGRANIGGRHYFAAARYNTDGSLDPSFGAGGRVITAVGGNDVAKDVVIQTDGKIVVVGLSDSFAGIVRYDSSGALDTTFNGGGKLRIAFGNDFGGMSVALQSDGKIVIAGRQLSGSIYSIAVVRITHNGSLDLSFDGDGRVVTSILTSSAASSIKIQPDGKILVSGTAYGSLEHFALVRYAPNGSLDPTFNGSGIVVTAIPGSLSSGSTAMDLSSDGKIILAGTSIFPGPNVEFTLVRYGPNGYLDPTFGVGGMSTISAGSNFEGPRKVVVQPDHRIVAAGSRYNGLSYEFALVRLGDLCATPEINIRGNGNTISDGDTTPSLEDHTDFGSVGTSSATVVRTFTIGNTGTADLNLSGTPKVAVSGPNAAAFTVTTEPTTPIAANGGTTTFQITFDPSAAGLHQAIISIVNGDADENPYDFVIQGFGLSSTPTPTPTPPPTVTPTPTPNGACQPASSGIVGWWPGEDSANDISGNGNNGVLGNGTVFGQGKVGQSFAFSGSNNVVVADSPVLNPASAITIETWIRPTGGENAHRDIVSKDGEFTERQYLLTISDINRLRAHVGTATQGFRFIDGATSVPLNTWTHAAMTYDGLRLRVFYNGVEDNSLAVSGQIVTTSQPVRIGGGAPAGLEQLFFPGSIDEPTIYDRALSQSEIVAIYHAGAAGKCAGQTPTPTPAPTPTPTGNPTPTPGPTVTPSPTPTGNPTPTPGPTVTPTSTPTPSPTPTPFPPCLGTPTFTQMPSVPAAGRYQQGVATGDFNDDNNEDLVFSNGTTSLVSVRFGNGAGGFSGGTDLLNPHTPWGIVVEKFNNDENLDIAVMSNNTGYVHVWLGNGNGTFNAPVAYNTASEWPVSFDAFDVNQDGELDLLSVNATAGNITVVYGDGNGGFSPPVSVSVGSGPASAAVADVNEDGNMDLVSANSLSNSISIRLGVLGGGFVPAADVPVGNFPRMVRAARFNGDRHADLVVTNYNDDTISVLLGDGRGNFSLLHTLPTANEPNYAVVADLNNDEKPDIIVTPNFASSLGVHIGDGAGGFTSLPGVFTDINSSKVAVGYFNNDGYADLATSNASGFSDRIIIHLGGCQSTTPSPTPSPTPISLPSPVPAASIQRWKVSNGHYALNFFGDGTLLAAYPYAVGVPGQPGSAGVNAVTMNPVNGGTEQSLISSDVRSTIRLSNSSSEQDWIMGGYANRPTFRQDGSYVKDLLELGCCNIPRHPFAYDHVNDRVWVAANGGIGYVDVPTNSITGVGTTGNSFGMVSLADAETAYTAGQQGYAAKTNSTTGSRWQVMIDSVRLQPGAIGADGSFVVTSGYAHFEALQPTPGRLARILPNGIVAFNKMVDAVTPPVVGGNGLIFVGTQPAPVSDEGYGAIEAYNLTGNLVWRVPVVGLPNDLLIGDDGAVYASTGGYSTGRIYAIGQNNGVVRQVVTDVDRAWEIVLRGGLLYASGAALYGPENSITAIPVAANNYDPASPWPVRYHDNQRTSNRTHPILNPPRVDLTPPVVVPSVIGTLGNSEWYTSDVTVQWNVTDDGSSVTSMTGCTTQTFTNDTSETTITCTATSEGGTTTNSITFKRDANGPVITADPMSPLPNSEGWNKTSVTVNWSCSDSFSGIVSVPGSQLIETEGAGQTRIGQCTDVAGNASFNTQVVSIDKTGPVASCPATDQVWHPSNVDLQCSTVDALSGLAYSGDASFLLSTSVPEGIENSNAATDSRGVCDRAGNCIAAGPITGNKIDRKAPTIDLQTPAEGAIYSKNQAIIAIFSCADGGSGATDCVGTAGSGSLIDTSSTGTKTFTVSSVDSVGNSASRTISYSVVNAPPPGTATADLYLSMSSSAPNSGVPSGTNILYQITLDNSGPDNAANVLVTSDMPSGARFVSASINDGTQGISLTVPAPGAANGSIVANISTLPPGERITIRFVLKLEAPRGNWITNLASVQSATFDPRNNNNTADVRVRIR